MKAAGFAIRNRDSILCQLEAGLMKEFLLKVEA